MVSLLKLRRGIKAKVIIFFKILSYIDEFLINNFVNIIKNKPRQPVRAAVVALLLIVFIYLSRRITEMSLHPRNCDIDYFTITFEVLFPWRVM